VIHVTAPDGATLDVIQFARDFSIPLVATYHTNFVEMLDHYGLFRFKPYARWFSGHVYSFVQALYAPTPYVVSLIKNDHQYDQCTDVRVWGRGVDLDQFSPRYRSEDFRRYWGIAPKDVVILFVGRLVLEKRPDIYANVIRRLHQDPDVHDFKALVIGAGNYQEELESIPDCICTGLMKFDQLPVAYASSDIFLFPSSWETFGNVTLEAAASGLPLVVSEGCSSHLVVNGGSGYECADGDENSFYNATKELVINSRKRKEFSLKSREHSFFFEKRAVVQQMLHEYQRVSHELHDSYQNDHKVRDANWSKNHKNPYRASALVRPLALRVLEYIMIYMANILWSRPFTLVWSFLFKKQYHKTAAPQKETFCECLMRLILEFLLFLFLLTVRIFSRPERIMFEYFREEIRPRMSKAKRRMKEFLQQ